MADPMHPTHSAPAVSAIGLMSGTSLDGVDAALLVSDGDREARPGLSVTMPYEPGLREALRGALGGNAPVDTVERAMTLAHADAVRTLLDSAGMTADQVDLLGFHGHTIVHDPQTRRTWQIGDGALLAARTGIDVVADFRSADVADGGEGAPLAPLYHAALAGELERPLAVLNVGGVANVTWIGGNGHLLAFDTGPGNALLNDWMRRHYDRDMDLDGAVADSGHVAAAVLDGLLGDPYFGRVPPKSLDRDHFATRAARALGGLSPTDGAATLTAFTTAAVAAAISHVPAPPRRWLVCGGGRHNPTLMAGLADRLGVPVAPVEAVGWHGDALEAQAFAYLAVRSRRGLALSLPGTTGVPEPRTGGRYFPAT